VIESATTWTASEPCSVGRYAASIGATKARCSLVVVVLGVVVGAQAALTGAEDFTKVMKANAQAVGAMNKAI